MTQKNEKIDLLENINRNTLDFQIVRNLQQELDFKSQKLEQIQKKMTQKKNKYARRKTMTLSNVARRSNFFANNPDLMKLRNSISKNGMSSIF